MILLPPNYKEQPVTWADISVASICWGFTLGFGFLTTWEAVCQTLRARAPLKSIYVWMIWGEIFVCLAFSIITWLHLYKDVLRASFFFYFSILTLWALQVHFLLQIIINRIAVIISDKQKATRLKFGVAAFITSINIAVYFIWIPARMQISERYIRINNVWDRTEKVIYLIVDACLNYYFVRVVRSRLVQQGSTKYDRLVKFNVRIILLSLSMDCMIIGAMSMSNTFVYVQFHPLAYIVKLNIEMSMAGLIRKVAKQKMPLTGYELSISTGTRHPQAANGGVVVQKEVLVESRSVEDHMQDQVSEISGKQHDDDYPLRNNTWGMVPYNTTNISVSQPQFQES
ncbi:hypothetical protein RUND412_000188 [Rhizina undulata]